MMTLSIMTLKRISFSIIMLIKMTLSMMILNIMSFSITAFGIIRLCTTAHRITSCSVMGLIVRISMNDIEQNDDQLKHLV